MTEAQTTQAAPDIEKFLSLSVTAGLNRGVHTHRALLDRFPPDAIMGFLDGEPAKRGRVLMTVLHIPPKTARSLSSADAGRLLQTGYDAEEAAPEKIIESLTPDDIARHFPRVALWAFITHNEWWKTPRADGKGDANAAPREFMAALLETALTCRLMTPNDILEGLDAGIMTRSLPKPLLEQVCEEGLKSGQRREPLDPKRVLEIVAVRQLVDALGQDYLYRCLIVPLAAKHGLVLDENAERNGPPTQGATPRSRSAPPLANGEAPAPPQQTGPIPLTQPKAPGTPAPPKAVSALSSPKSTTKRPPAPPLARDTTRDAKEDEGWDGQYNSGDGKD